MISTYHISIADETVWACSNTNTNCLPPRNLDIQLIPSSLVKCKLQTIADFNNYGEHFDNGSKRCLLRAPVILLILITKLIKRVSHVEGKFTLPFVVCELLFTALCFTVLSSTEIILVLFECLFFFIKSLIGRVMIPFDGFVNWKSIPILWGCIYISVFCGCRLNEQSNNLIALLYVHSWALVVM